MKIQRVTQISEDHCGPAVLQMQLGAIGLSFTQEEITQAADAEDSIEDYGVTIDQIGRAATVLAPGAQFWYKFHSTLDDIRYILEQGFPVGVEWQGLFYDSVEEEEEEEDDDHDFGHYSVVSHMDDELQQLIIVDPYKDFVKQDRIIEYDLFERRWWDLNDIRDQYTRQWQTVKDEQLLFFVAPKGTYFPKELGFKAFSVVE